MANNVTDLKGLVYDKYSITLQKTKKTIAFNLRRWLAWHYMLRSRLGKKTKRIIFLAVGQTNTQVSG